MTTELAGTATMIRFVLRRNWARLAAWLVALIALFGFVASYYKTLFPTQKSLDDFAAVSDTPGIKAITGLAAAANTIGGAVWTKIWMTLVITLALAVIFLVTRNGRADEELGRAELLRSRMLGRHASSAATWLVCALLSLVVGAGVAVVSILSGLDPAGAGITGSLVTGASITGVGLVGLAVGAVAGQLATTSRGANGLGAIVIGLFFVLRMIGDLGTPWLTSLSPVGWGEQMKPWGSNRWWPLGLMVLLVVALLALATVLEGRRDYGSGLLPQRAGRAYAPARYATPLGLGIRLQRGPIIGWLLTIVLCGLLFGSVVKSMTDLLRDATPQVRAMFQGSGVDALLSLLVVVIALLAAVFAIFSALQLRADEASGMVEPQFAGALSRTRWSVERLLIPAVGAAVLLVIGGGVLGLVYGATSGDNSQFARLALAALAYWPAIMVLVGVTVALFGWLPRTAVAISWALLAAMWFAIVVGDALHIPDWLLNLLPLTATPRLPVQSFSWTPLVVMTLVAAGLIALGLARFARRDVQA